MFDWFLSTTPILILQLIVEAVKNWWRCWLFIIHELWPEKTYKYGLIRSPTWLVNLSCANVPLYFSAFKHCAAFAPFLYSVETTEKQRFFDIFSGYRNGTWPKGTRKQSCKWERWHEISQYRTFFWWEQLTRVAGE